MAQSKEELLALMQAGKLKPKEIEQPKEVLEDETEKEIEQEKKPQVKIEKRLWDETREINDPKSIASLLSEILNHMKRQTILLEQLRNKAFDIPMGKSFDALMEESLNGR